jgi:hypothetical protein
VDAIIETDAGERRAPLSCTAAGDWERTATARPRYAGVMLHVVAEDDGVPSRLPGAQSALLELAALDARRRHTGAASRLAGAGGAGTRSPPCWRPARRAPVGHPLAGGDAEPVRSL